MKKLKHVPKRVLHTAKWEILSTAEWIIENFPNNQPLTNAALMSIYKGNAVSAILTGKIASVQKWGVTIVTTAKDKDGNIHTHQCSWRVLEPMTFNDFMNGEGGHKINRGHGLKTRWLGVAKEWIKMVDSDLADMDAIEAHATANCLAQLKPTRKAA